MIGADPGVLRSRLIEVLRAVPAYEVADPRAVAALEDPDGDPSFESLGIDSLGRMEVCILLSERFGVELAADDLVSHATVGALVQHLAETSAGTAGRAGAPDPAADARSVDVFVAAFLRSRSPAESYRALEDFDRWASPGEAAAVLERLSGVASLEPEARTGLEDLRRWMTTEDPRPRALEARPHGASARSFWSPASQRPRAGLVIALAGNAHRLFLPTPVVLQHLPTTHDVLFLVDPARAGFSRGIPGIAEDLEGLARWVRGTLVGDDADVVCIGASSGGAAALELAVHLRARRGISMGSRPVPSLAGLDTGGVELWALHNAENVGDREGAIALQGLLPDLERLVIPGESTHNILLPALKAARLTEFLDLLVRGDVSRMRAQRGPDGAWMLPRYERHAAYAKPRPPARARLLRRLVPGALRRRSG